MSSRKWKNSHRFVKFEIFQKFDCFLILKNCQNAKFVKNLKSLEVKIQEM